MPLPASEGVSRDLSRPLLLLVTLALFLALVLPRLTSRGMFFDGITYAAIARNSAAGAGSFWNPHYTDTIYSSFHEHPPLAFWMQSIAFRVFGDSPYVESFYGLATGLVVLFLMMRLWAALGGGERAGGWFPALLFAVFPLTSWILASNMLENTMTVFTTAAVLAVCRAAFAGSRAGRIVGGAVAGLLVAAAFLSKGPVGVFPIVAPFLCVLALPRARPSAGLAVFAGLFLALLVVAGALYAAPEARDSLGIYLEKQVLASVKGERGSGSTFTFKTLKALIADGMVPLALAAIVAFAHRRSAPVRRDRRALFMLLVGLSASLPFFIGPRQSRYYLYPSIPFYMLALAFLFAGAAGALEERLRRSAAARGVAATLAALLFAGAVAGAVAERGAVRKYGDFHEDFTVQKPAVPPGEVYSVLPPDLRHEWPFVANMARCFRASLTDEPGHRYLIRRLDAAEPAPVGYRRIHPPAPRRYEVYERDERTPAPVRASRSRR
ncbi:MAG: glycosyltransferase family 39 protein [Candidatus Eisenbacteria bacterium]|nr:glycosyltransferase family 39 protein [Candidatus Eisenbacteria bacterium]